jgi:peptidoglycan/xylan/chitin deacetylase (PgdA/CDA1 family)
LHGSFGRYSTKVGGAYRVGRLRSSTAAGRADTSSKQRYSGQAVLLTFDDGWRDAVEVGGPILQSERCQAMLFVTTDFVGQRHFLSRHDLKRLPRGLFRIGSHARTHRMLSRLSETEIRGELRDSKHFLEEVAGHAIDALSIPNGAVDERVERIASEAGYRFLFTSQVHVNTPKTGPMHIGRVAIKQNTSIRTFQRYARGQLALEQVRRWLLSAPKSLLGLARYEKMRRRLLGETARHRQL